MISKLPRPSNVGVELVQRVEQRDVDVVNLLVAKVAQVAIDLGERLRNQHAVLAVGDRELLGRMDVIKRQPVRGRGDRSSTAARTENGGCGTNGSHQEAASSYRHRDLPEASHHDRLPNSHKLGTRSHYGRISLL